MRNELFGFFGKGRVTLENGAREVANLSWTEHKDFQGVFLKNIITGEDTGNMFTCHLVRVEPGCAIGLHTHPSSMELHEVVAGDGACHVGDGIVAYSPGSMALMPRGVAHEVRAGKDGLCILAKFVTFPEKNSAP